MNDPLRCGNFIIDFEAVSSNSELLARLSDRAANVATADKRFSGFGGRAVVSFVLSFCRGANDDSFGVGSNDLESELLLPIPLLDPLAFVEIPFDWPPLYGTTVERGVDENAGKPLP